MTNPVGTDMNHIYNRAAKMRAFIIAHLNNQAGECSTREIVDAISPQVKALGAKDNAITYQLRMLADSKMIYRSKAEDGYALRFAKKSYTAKKPSQDAIKFSTENDDCMNLIVLSEPSVAVAAVKKVESEKITVISKEVDQTLPTFSIDVVKETGKVRLYIGGLLLEIGVV